MIANQFRLSKNSKKLAPDATFNFKLDDSLNILEVGSRTDYFAADEYTEY